MEAQDSADGLVYALLHRTWKSLFDMFVFIYQHSLNSHHFVRALESLLRAPHCLFSVIA